MVTVPLIPVTCPGAFSKKLRPSVPPVSPENFLISDGIATARPKVARARYRPESRSAGRPIRKPTIPAARPASGMVQTSRQCSWVTRIAVV